MLQFIETNLSAGMNIYVSTAYSHIKVSPKTLAKFQAANHPLFKIDEHGFLLMARGKRYDAICGPNTVLVRVSAMVD